MTADSRHSMFVPPNYANSSKPSTAQQIQTEKSGLTVSRDLKTMIETTPVFTRCLTISCQGQQLVTFTSNRNADSKPTEQVNNIMDSLRLEE